MGCDDLDVFDRPTAITVLVLEPGVRELNVPVLVRQMVLVSPLSDGV
jgi:hypothetical protein